MIEFRLGICMEDAKTGENHYPKLELVRLTISRRVFMQEHLDFATEGIKRVYQRRHEIKGLKMTYEPKQLRFFQAHFEPL